MKNKLENLIEELNAIVKEVNKAKNEAVSNSSLQNLNYYRGQEVSLVSVINRLACIIGEIPNEPQVKVTVPKFVHEFIDEWAGWPLTESMNETHLKTAYPEVYEWLYGEGNSFETIKKRELDLIVATRTLKYEIEEDE